VGDIANLQDEHHNPVYVGNCLVHGKGTPIQVVLVPYCPREMHRIVSAVLVERVVHRRDDGEEPCQDGKDLVGDDGVTGMLLPFGERVYRLEAVHVAMT